MKKKHPQPFNKHNEVLVSSQFSGPLPPPDALAHYNNIIPGAAERILRMAESEAENRHRNERKVVDNVVRSSFLGIFFAFASVVLMVVLAYFALIYEYPTVATSIVVINIASVAGIFIFFRNKSVK